MASGANKGNIRQAGTNLPIRVLMVCLGNICRSPTAHGVLARLVAEAGLSHAIEVDSAGTADFHLGKSPDPRSTAAAAKRGYDLQSLVARQVTSRDLVDFDYVIAMDTENLGVVINLQAEAEAASTKVGLLLSFSGGDRVNVPDPYYSGEEGFEEVLDLVEDSCKALLDEIIATHDITY